MTRSRRIQAAVVLAVAALPFSACGHDGAVVVQINPPSDMTLSPVDARLATLTLLAEADGHPPETATRDVSDRTVHTVDFGVLSVGPGVRLSLLASSPAGRMVGFGRAAVPIDVSPDQLVTVPINLRRPYAYVAGSLQLDVFDTTMDDLTKTGGLMRLSPSNPTAVATTPDGAEIVVIAAGQLSLISTSDHKPEGTTRATLRGPAAALGVSADSRWAVVLHSGAGGGVSLVDLAALRAGQPSVSFVAVANPGALSVGLEAAWVLTNATTGDTCTGVSSLVSVPLALPAAAGAPVALSTGARDIAWIPSGSHAGGVAVAEPCVNLLQVLDRTGAPTASAAPTVALPAATTVSVSAGRVYGIGHMGMNTGGTLHLVLVSAPLDGTSAPTRIDLPAIQEIAHSNDFSQPGTTTEIRVSAKTLDAYELSVLPDAQHVVYLLHSTYHSNALSDAIGVLIPAIDIETFEYQLLDATTGGQVQRVRTRCNISWTPNNDPTVPFNDFSCDRSPGQYDTAESFVPVHAAVLYGDR